MIKIILGMNTGNFYTIGTAIAVRYDTQRDADHNFFQRGDKMNKVPKTTLIVTTLLIFVFLSFTLAIAAKNHDRDKDLWDGAALNVDNAHGEDVADLVIPAGVYNGWAGLTAQMIAQPHPDFSGAASFWWNLHTQGDVDWAGMLTLYYDESLLNGIPEEALTVHHYNGTDWIKMNGTVDTEANTISVFVGKDDFSPYVVSQDEFDQSPRFLTQLNLVNYPNPFHRQTTISFALPNSGKVSISIYDVTGRIIASVIKDEIRSAGGNVVVWDGSDDRGADVPSGVYFYELRYGNEVHQQKMTLVK